ncbi:MAG: class I SAM-dependent methyltransferase [Flavobacteriales bacterium]|nr:class I SAM-dependent methyltransferase [Flavobacteriales bacterium]
MEPVHRRDASVYDREFIHSRIGLVQRRAVWNYLDLLLRNPGMHVLELNTGEATDAMHIARQGHRVIATDPSHQLLLSASERIRQYGLEDRITLDRLPFEELGERPWPNAFDLVMSDTGGLNRLDQDGAARAIRDVAGLLRHTGRFVAVIQPDRCLRETLHELSRGRWRVAFRRGKKDELWSAFSGSGAVLWNHAPSLIERLAAPWFRTVNIRPVGFFVPPNHHESRYHDRPRLLDRLAALDERVAGWRWTARYADHYLIDLERRP